MVDWVENGKAPTEFVAAKYTNNNVTQGVQFTRKLCPVRSCLHSGGDPVGDLRPSRLSTRKRQSTREVTRTRPIRSSALERLEESLSPKSHEEKKVKNRKNGSEGNKEAS